LRFKGLMVKEAALGEELFGSRFFSSFVAAGVVNRNQMEGKGPAGRLIVTKDEENDLKQVFSRLVVQKLEEPVAGTSAAAGSGSGHAGTGAGAFVILRSLIRTGLLDVNVRRSFAAARTEAKVLESMGAPLYANRANLRARHMNQSMEIVQVCRLVSEYNVLIGRLSDNEKGVFRNRLLMLDRRMWNGVYKITWQSTHTLRSWVNMCNETIISASREVEEYKEVGAAMNQTLTTVARTLILFDEPVEGSVTAFLT